MPDTSHLPDTVVRRLLERKFWNELRMANMSYTDPDEREDVGPYKYARNMSNKEHGIWHYHEDKITHYSPRGTRVKRDYYSTVGGEVLNRPRPTPR